MGIDAKMYFVTGRTIPQAELLKLSYDAGLTFGPDRFLRDEKGWQYKAEGEVVSYPPHHNISGPLGKIEQDGPDWRPPKGKKLYRVHVMTRYYGPGYERGDLPFLVILAEWLERRVPGCQIMYGGDSSGVCAQPWGPEERKEFLDHFASRKGRDYFTERNPFMDRAGAEPICKFCGSVPMTQTMFGGGIGNLRGGFVCHGCGAKTLRTEGGKFIRIDPYAPDLECWDEKHALKEDW